MINFKDPVKNWDIGVASAFAVLITFQPYFMHGRINIFEVGLYLPGIQAVLNGEIPYRDFFHLRGPFELYMPAFLMKIFGVHLNVLYLYFYVGSVVCLIAAILIAAEVLQTRAILYIFTLALIGRTWPRVVFTYWGGMRYAFGLLAVWCFLRFFRTQKILWLFVCGLLTTAGLLTSVEVGIYILISVVATVLAAALFKVMDFAILRKGFGGYLLGLGVSAVPYGLYLFYHNAFFPYIESVYTIVTNMQNTLYPHLVSIYPRNFWEALNAMINPVHTNFKHMTPSYVYLIILAYLIYRVINKKFDLKDCLIFGVGTYGFIIYNTAFRGIWAAQFEMALQPEKILYFLVLERLWLWSLHQKDKWRKIRPLTKISLAKIVGVYLFCFGLFGSSVGWAIQRYNHRFFVFQYIRTQLSGADPYKIMPYLDDNNFRPLTIETAKGIRVPHDQADELEAIDRYLQEHTLAEDIILTYPELGTYNFLFSRRHFGRFPIATFAWFNEKWQDEFMQELAQHPPKHIIVQKEMPMQWKQVYFGFEKNIRKYKAMMDFIEKNYRPVYETSASQVYQFKQESVYGQ